MGERGSCRAGNEAVNLLNRWESSRHTPCAVASKTKGFCIADGTWNVPATINSQPIRERSRHKRNGEACVSLVR